MKHIPASERPDSKELRIALSEVYPDATYGAIPVSDQLDAYRAYDDGTLAEAPHAFAAFLAHQRLNNF